MNLENNLSKAQILILGTYHFGDAGKHAVNAEVTDVLGSEKQQEIIDVINKLIEFKPNKIAVEKAATSDQVLNEDYKQYCLDNYILKRSEVEQIGFRIGKMLNLPKIHPIDVKVDLPFEALIEYAEKHTPEIYEQFQNNIVEMSKIQVELQKNASVRDILKYFNDKKRANEEHSGLYLEMTQVGAFDTYCGADFLLAWYNRNIKIFANLQAIAEPNDRILVIYGAGHLKILSEFVNNYSKMQLVDANTYL